MKILYNIARIFTRLSNYEHYITTTFCITTTCCIATTCCITTTCCIITTCLSKTMLYSDVNNTECVECKQGTFANKPTNKCTDCPKDSVRSAIEIRS